LALNNKPFSLLTITKVITKLESTTQIHYNRQQTRLAAFNPGEPAPETNIQ